MARSGASVQSGDVSGGTEASSKREECSSPPIPTAGQEPSVTGKERGVLLSSPKFIFPSHSGRGNPRDPT